MVVEDFGLSSRRGATLKILQRDVAGSKPLPRGDNKGHSQTSAFAQLNSCSKGIPNDFMCNRPELLPTWHQGVLCGFVLTNLDHDPLTRRRAWVTTPSVAGSPLPTTVKNHILKGRFSVLISVAFSLQVVDVNLLKSPLNVCRKLVFNQRRSQASLMGPENQKQEILWNPPANRLSTTPLPPALLTES